MILCISVRYRNLDYDSKHSAKLVEVIDIDRSKVWLEGSEDIGKRDSQGLNLLPIDLWLLDRQGNRKAVLNTRFSERYPESSPDGKRLAHTSDESGRFEVYVRPFPGPGKPVQISTNGGQEPCWSRDQREIFYSVASPPVRWAYYAVQIMTNEGQVRPGLPEKLSEGRYGAVVPVRLYDVGADGRFLLTTPDRDNRSRYREAMSPTRIELVQNWFEELRAKVPVE